MYTKIKCWRTLVVDDVPEGEVGAEAAIAPLNANADESSGFSDGVLVGARDAQHRAHVEFGHVDLRAAPHHVGALQFLAHEVAKLEIRIREEFGVDESVVGRNHHPIVARRRSIVAFFLGRQQGGGTTGAAADLPTALMPKFAWKLN